jgi:hypothetical protein
MRMIAEKHQQRSLLLTLLLYRAKGGDPMLPEGSPRDLDELAALFMRFPAGAAVGHWEAILGGHPALAELEASLGSEVSP